jgi:hypothetical protein
MSNSTASSSGIGFTGLLTVLFIGLKLTNYITWSWWWVLSPLWIGFAIALIFLIIGFFVIVGAAAFATKTRTRVQTSSFQKKLLEMQKKREQS